ncbi:hypothetical protein CQA53_01685 [Helicobacter didelphidarum]|uniref:Uncharacterized protein n=1 Tax=Helicobacter didelphidarum TaxID=2040648 RepID=A0A3D8IQW4_9HELI|nr:hypothetical protein [Helicobacter didelphidarum]RDU67001.1 hypothetical protein CQA53_01685 [Helicobacter didelphidarum]
MKRVFLLCWIICGYIYAINSHEAQSLQQVDSIQEITKIQQTKDEQIKFIYGFDFDFFADNLEDSALYWATRTLLTAGVFPEIGASFYGHKVRVGGYFLANMGEKFPNPKDNRMGITLYYDTSYKNFKGYFGILPRKYWLGKYPALYYRQDFKFFNPVMNGMLFQYDSKEQGFKAEFLLDWYGGNLQKRIDEFLVQTFLRKDFFGEKFFLGGSALLFHTKNPEILNPNATNLDVFLLDRFYYNVFIGGDFQTLMPYMDAMNLRLGILASVERKRRESTGVDPFSHSLGGQFDIQAQFKGFGIFNSLYYGQRQMKYFNEYGENLYWGLPFYQSNLYNRTELYWEYKNVYLKARFSIIFHATQNLFSNQQMLTITLDTEKLIQFLKH